MNRVILDIPPDVHRAALDHLLPKKVLVERAAFVFARFERGPAETVFRYVDWVAVTSDGTDYESAQHLVLSDATRAAVIKRAHDLGASLVEFHSHVGPWPATFSLSDKAGFEEFVPHVWWRLKGKPYAAVVVAQSGFDALCWLDGPREPRPLSALRVGGHDLAPTALTFDHWREVGNG